LESIPEVVEKSLAILHQRGTTVEGLFRISGAYAKIDELKKNVDKGKKVNIEAENPHTIAGFVKLYFRELPQPILPGNKLKKLLIRSAGNTSIIIYY
jgi:hypothetical protein